MTYHQVSDKSLKEFKELCDKKGIKYESEAEYEEAARNLIGLFEILIEADKEERSRRQRLIKEPKGFAIEGKGRNCSLCRRGVYDGDGWYDKWGFKCMNCQDAVNKKKIPGSLCRDWDNEKCITESSLAYKTGLHAQTIRKLIRNGEIKARQIPKGPAMILRKDNPNIKDILVHEQTLQAEKSKSKD